MSMTVRRSWAGCAPEHSAARSVPFRCQIHHRDRCRSVLDSGFVPQESRNELSGPGNQLECVASHIGRPFGCVAQGMEIAVARGVQDSSGGAVRTVEVQLVVRHGFDDRVELPSAGRQLAGRQPDDGVDVGVGVGVGPAAYRSLSDDRAVDGPGQVYGAGGNVQVVEVMLRGSEVILPAPSTASSKGRRQVSGSDSGDMSLR